MLRMVLDLYTKFRNILCQNVNATNAWDILFIFLSHYFPCNCISLRPKIWYGLYWIQVKKATLEPDVNLTISLFPRLVRVFSSSCNFNPIHGIVIFYNLELQFVRKKYLIIHWHVDLSLNFFMILDPDCIALYRQCDLNRYTTL